MCDACVVSWFKRTGPIGIVCTSRHNGVLVACMDSGLVGGLLFATRAAMLACTGGLAFLMHVCLR